MDAGKAAQIVPQKDFKDNSFKETPGSSLSRVLRVVHNDFSTHNLFLK
jgi:hypothetical protein